MASNEQPFRMPMSKRGPVALGLWLVERNILVLVHGAS